jgi:hypothetical protein
MPTYNQQSEPGMFLETTALLDTQSIYQLDIKSDQFKEFLVDLRQMLEKIIYAVNIKDTGYYPLKEFVCGKALFPNPLLNSSTPQTPVWRQVFRQFYLWPTNLPNNATQTLAHDINITDEFTFITVHGCANQTVPHKYVDIPYVSADPAPKVIELFADATNINIVTNFDATAYNVTYICLEYIKQ